MPMADDDYRKRLANRMMQGTEATSNPIGAAYARGFGYLGDFIKDTMNPLMRLPEDISKGDKGAVALTLGTAGMGGKGGKGSKFAIEHINKRYLKDFIEYARMRAMQGEGIAAEEWAKMGMRVPDLSANRANAERAALAFVQKMIDMGASPATINRFVRFVPQREVDPLEAAINVGVKDLSREIPSSAERLADRLRRQIDESFTSF